MVIALVSLKGGVGKSTLAVSLAWEWMATGLKVLVVDADLKRATCRLTAEEATERGRPSPTVVSMGVSLAQRHALPALVSSFDHVVIDTPGGDEEMIRAALRVAELALIPVGQSAADAWSVMDTASLVRDMVNLNPKLSAALVLAKLKPRSRLGLEARRSLKPAQVHILRAQTTDRVAWQECLEAGQGVAQYAPESGAAVELRAMVTELKSLHRQRSTR